MSKRSGFAVKITAFIEADANDGESMATALRTIKEQYSIFTEARFLVPELITRFMLNCTVPDAPKPLEAMTLRQMPPTETAPLPPSHAGRDADIKAVNELPRMPDLPPDLDASKRRP